MERKREIESKSQEINTLRHLFGDDHVTVTDSGDVPQIYIHTLETVTSKNGLKILTNKTKTMENRKK
jgi:hypothetical protein